MRQAQIQQANTIENSSLKDKILTLLNHEMRTPLMLIVSYSDMLSEMDVQEISKWSDEEFTEFMGGINAGADRLRRLIENFMLLVELQSGEAIAENISYHKTMIMEYKPIIHDAIDKARAVSIHQNKISVYIAEDVPPILADPNYFVVILRELIDNAMKFSPEGSNCTCACAGVEGPWSPLPCRARAVPSRRNEVNRIWEPFYQVNREYHEDQGAGSGPGYRRRAGRLPRGPLSGAQRQGAEPLHHQPAACRADQLSGLEFRGQI